VASICPKALLGKNAKMPRWRLGAASPFEKKKILARNVQC